MDSEAIDELAEELSRPPILPDSADYEEARRVFNKMIDKRPALIVRCGGVADVLRAVRFARDHDLSWRCAAGRTTPPASRPATAAS